MHPLDARFEAGNRRRLAIEARDRTVVESVRVIMLGGSGCHYDISDHEGHLQPAEPAQMTRSRF